MSLDVATLKANVLKVDEDALEAIEAVEDVASLPIVGDIPGLSKILEFAKDAASVLADVKEFLVES